MQAIKTEPDRNQIQTNVSPAHANAGDVTYEYNELRK
jgi:hypothetical protein